MRNREGDQQRGAARAGDPFAQRHAGHIPEPAARSRAIATLLAGQNSPLDLRGHGPGRMQRLVRSNRAPARAAAQLVARASSHAMSWLAEIPVPVAILLRALLRQVMAVDFDAFLADVSGGMRRVLTHFGLPADDRLTAQLAGHSRCSSNTQRRLSTHMAPPSGRKCSTVRVASIGTSSARAAWLASLARSDETVADVLDAEAG